MKKVVGYRPEAPFYLKEGDFADAGVFFSHGVFDCHLAVVFNPALTAQDVVDTGGDPVQLVMIPETVTERDGET